MKNNNRLAFWPVSFAATRHGELFVNKQSTNETTNGFDVVQSIIQHFSFCDILFCATFACIQIITIK